MPLNVLGASSVRGMPSLEHPREPALWVYPLAALRSRGLYSAYAGIAVVKKNTPPTSGWLANAIHLPSPNFDARPKAVDIEAIILHSISLPPGQYSWPKDVDPEQHPVVQFFQNRLEVDEHPFYAEIQHLCVSSHFVILRDGTLLQCVSTAERAWHAGESFCLGRPCANDFTIGVELEGWDESDDGFESEQYDTLKALIKDLQIEYPKILTDNLFSHSDIAQGRKQDPGPFFEWSRVLA